MDKTRVYVILKRRGYSLYGGSVPCGMLHSKQDAEFYVDKMNGHGDDYYSYEVVESVPQIDRSAKEYRKFIEGKIEALTGSIRIRTEKAAEFSNKNREEIAELTKELDFYNSLKV